ncbi:MAG: hypothetical protein VW455_02750 [Nitrospinota bacterium]
MNVDLMKNLKSQGTWRLFFFIMVTLTIYYGHYIKRQSRWINEAIADENEKLSSNLVNGILVLGYLNAASSIASALYKEGLLILLLGVAHYAWITCLCVWSVVAGRKVNTLNSAEEGSDTWFNAFWGMFFTPLYFNFKVNQLNQKLSISSAT